jgi:hypothetical protein
VGVATPVRAETAANTADAKVLFCAYWTPGVTPRPLPVGFESQFALAVVEINNLTATPKASVSDFALVGEKGIVASLKRVINVEDFDEPRGASEDIVPYYMHTSPIGGTRPWNGTLPAGMIRLRVRVALADDPIGPLRCRLTVGPYVIEGPITTTWAT